MVPLILHRKCLVPAGKVLKGKSVVISGSGNVAQYAVEKVTAMGGKVVTLSDSNGFIYDPKGIDKDKLIILWN